MTNPSAHLRYHDQRAADLVREARRHDLSRVHPLERRAPLGRLRRFLGRPPAEPVYVREFPVA